MIFTNTAWLISWIYIIIICNLVIKSNAPTRFKRLLVAAKTCLSIAYKCWCFCHDSRGKTNDNHVAKRKRTDTFFAIYTSTPRGLPLPRIIWNSPEGVQMHFSFSSVEIPFLVCMILNRQNHISTSDEKNELCFFCLNILFLLLSSTS